MKTWIASIGFLAVIGTIIYLFVAGKESFAMQLFQYIIIVPSAFGAGMFHQRNRDNTPKE